MTVRNTIDCIAADCDYILAFLRGISLKAPQVQAAPLSLRADKREKIWFRQWVDSILKHKAPPNKAAPQDHSGLTGVLSEVATRLQNEKSPHPVVPEQREADRETRGWDCLPPTAQQVILEASASNGITILPAPLCSYTAFSMHATRRHSNPTAHSTTRETLFSSQPVSVRPFFKATYFQVPNPERRQVCPRYSLLLHQRDRKTLSREQ